ncbi:MAG: 2Fe-2S iron-sulfur cluster-binding protein [Kangiellaceae bacterium]|nr:2Fe-2S iron-sulfur cluster-binding protein [Kangiellaceae bacterium]
MISILRQALIDAVKTRYLSSITLIAVARNMEERAFYNEIEDIVGSSNSQINVYWCLTRPEKHARLGIDYDFKGRPNLKLTEQIVQGVANEVYVCGPKAFMQSSYDILRQLKIDDSKIYAETFGPSVLKRDNQTERREFAEQALISIEQSNSDSVVEQQWSQNDGSLLEFLESHGFSPSFACRSGKCGSCKVKIKKGMVSHFISPDVTLGDDEILLCSSKPSKQTGNSIPSVTIRLE